MLSECCINKSMCRRQKLIHRAVTLNQVAYEPDRLQVHRLPQSIGELCESRSVDSNMLLEKSEVQPVATELDRQCLASRIVQHSPYLSSKDFPIMKSFFRCQCEQLVSAAATVVYKDQ